MNLRKYLFTSSFITAIAIVFVLLIAAGCAVILEKQIEVEQQSQPKPTISIFLPYQDYKTDELTSNLNGNPICLYGNWNRDKEQSAIGDKVWLDRGVIRLKGSNWGDVGVIFKSQGLSVGVDVGSNVVACGIFNTKAERPAYGHLGGYLSNLSYQIMFTDVNDMLPYKGQLKTVEDCSKIPSQIRKDICYWDFAVRGGQNQACDMIYDNAVKQSCNDLLKEANDTSTWQTYRNEQYGFEMKYPPELAASVSMDEALGRHNVRNVFAKEFTLPREEGEFPRMYSLRIEQVESKNIEDWFKNYLGKSLCTAVITKNISIYDTTVKELQLNDDCPHGDTFIGMLHGGYSYLLIYHGELFYGQQGEVQDLIGSGRRTEAMAKIAKYKDYNRNILQQILSTFKFIEPSDNSTDRRCGNYTRNGVTTEQCAICGDRICESYERCVSSHISGGIATADCGPLNCPEDCQNN